MTAAGLKAQDRHFMYRQGTEIAREGSGEAVIKAAEYLAMADGAHERFKLEFDLNAGIRYFALDEEHRKDCMTRVLLVTAELLVD